MSWSIELGGGPEHDKGIGNLKEAIERAKGSNILMFCAASDQGASSKINYPATWGNCIRIGAATTTGEKLAWVGDDIDFLFPGENISFVPTEGGPTINKPGSSVATALASGYAGLILCLERIYGSNTVLKPNSYPTIKDKLGMEIALNSLSTPTSDRKGSLDAQRLQELRGKRWAKGPDKRRIIEALDRIFHNIDVSLTRAPGSASRISCANSILDER